MSKQNSSIRYNHVDSLFGQAIQELEFPPIGIPIKAFPKFTKYIGGLRPHEFTLFCAPTGAGKTEWIANLIAHVMATSVACFAAPVETGDVDFTKRIISILHGKELNTGDPVNKNILEEISQKQKEFMKKSKLFIASYEDRIDIDEMINLLKLLNEKYKIKLAVLDNLNFFLKPTRSQDQILEMDEAIHKFIIAAKVLPMHTLLIVHPKKTINGRVESEFDIKGSSTAVQEAHNVILFNRPTQEQIEKEDRRYTDRELVFKKIRKRGMFVNHPIWFGYIDGMYKEKI